MCSSRIGELLKEIPANFTLKPDATPKFVKARHVPYALKPKVEIELETLVKKCVAEKCDFGEWAASIVPVRKKYESVLVCGDFKVTLQSDSLKVDQCPFFSRIKDIFVVSSTLPLHRTT